MSPARTRRCPSATPPTLPAPAPAVPALASRPQASALRRAGFPRFGRAGFARARTNLAAKAGRTGAGGGVVAGLARLTARMA